MPHVTDVFREVCLTKFFFSPFGIQIASRLWKIKIHTLCSRTDLMILRGQKSHVGKFLCDIYIFEARMSRNAALPEHCICFVFLSYPVNLLLVRWCPFRLVWSLEHVQNFPPDKTDRDARLMYGRNVASVRGEEFCHRITKFRMFCLLSLRNESICRSDQAFRKKLWLTVKLLKISNFTFSHNDFYEICMLKSFNSHISVVVWSFFEFGTVS